MKYKIKLFECSKCGYQLEYRLCRKDYYCPMCSSEDDILVKMKIKKVFNTDYDYIK